MSNATSLRLQLHRAGYSPIPVEGKAPAPRAWQQIVNSNPEEIALWERVYPYAGNTGILCRTTPCIDIDITNAEAAEAVEALLKERFEERGYCLVRTGKPPKRAVLFRTDASFKKLILPLVAPNGDTTQKIEILGDGQQVVVAGIHPETKQPYSWHGGEPWGIPVAELPYISEEIAQRFLQDAAKLLTEQFGYTRPAERPKHKRTGAPDDEGAGDWAWLMKNIREGHELHDSLRDLGAKLVASGMSAGAAVNQLRGLMEASTAPRDDRWRQRYEDIPRLVDGAEKFREDGGARVNGKEAGPAGDLDEWDAGDDPGFIPPRQWLLANQFCRTFISSVVAAGGGGKTALRLLQFISLALGRSLCGQHVFRRCRVLLISLEDDRDELQRRIKAILDHYGIKRSELKGWLFCATPRLAKLAVMTGKARAIGPLERWIRKAIERRKPDLVSLDPFIKTHSLEENDSGDMDFVCDLLARIAVEFNIAVDSPHHVHKGQVTPGDADSGRGSSGIRDAGRLVYTLVPMSEDEAKAFNISPDVRWSYVRLDSSKVNIVARGGKPMWFHIIGMPIGNATDEYPNGDTVQVVEPWTPPSAWADTTPDGLNAILTNIDRGMSNGQRFSNAPAAGERAVWPAVQRAYPRKAEAQCREIVNAWLATGLLYSTDYDDPVQRKPRKGLFVDDAKRPS
jgi:hypothetical protein